NEERGNYVQCKEVEVDGVYKINGWQFVSTLEHTENGNIVRCADLKFSGNIPEGYLNCGPKCEHCNRIRDRKDTYLVYNEENDEFKQVGKSCLQGYTDGIDASVCASIMSILDECKNEESSFGVGYYDPYFSGDEVRQAAFYVVERFGYKKVDSDESSYMTICDLLKVDSNHKGFDDKIYEKKVEEMTNFLTENTDDTEYFRNAMLAWKKQYVEYRDISLMASFVNYYFKKLTKKEEVEKCKADWVGNEGDKISVKFESFRCVTSYSTEIGWHNFVTTLVYEFIGEDNNIYIWKTQKWIGDEDMRRLTQKTISGTIKAHEWFGGKKQNILTRCKLL
ncbi:MAG: hypothetical protein MJ072_07125, partial [Clostridia bacterium]|nr:hypothetical protein [Clostridia bacterium]